MVQAVEAWTDQQPLAQPAERHVDVGVRPALDQPADHQDHDVFARLDAHELREQHERQRDDQVVDHVVSVVGPYRHAPLAVVQAVQRPPPSEGVLPPVKPVGREVVEHEIDEEREQVVVPDPRQQALQARRHVAPRPHRQFDLLHHRVGQDEDGERDDAKLVQHRVDAVDHDEPVVPTRLLERPAALEEAHADRDHGDLDEAQHDELDGAVARLVPGHEAEMKKDGADEGLEQPGLDVDPEVDQVVHGAPTCVRPPSTPRGPARPRRSPWISA